jgi:hypothetical protein
VIDEVQSGPWTGVWTEKPDGNEVRDVEIPFAVTIGSNVARFAVGMPLHGWDSLEWRDTVEYTWPLP